MENRNRVSISQKTIEVFLGSWFSLIVLSAPFANGLLGFIETGLAGQYPPIQLIFILGFLDCFSAFRGPFNFAFLAKVT